MKLSRNTEYAVIAAIIAYIAFFPRIQAISTLLATPVGKAVALAGIVYVWKCVSAVVALLLVVAYLRCVGAGSMIWEGMTSVSECTCPEGFNYDAATGVCKSPDGAETKDPITCACQPGFSYDVKTKQCVQNSSITSPMPPIVEPTTAVSETTAPANAPAPPGPTSTAPATTPGAAQDMATGAPPAAAPTSTVSPNTTETFALGGYPLY
jgi:hypothetical protein